MFEISNETKNYLIIFLLLLTLFSLLGINLLSEAGDGFEWGITGVVPYIKKVLGIIGWSTGSVINVSTDIVSDTARAGIDVAEGSVQSVGNLLQSASKGGMTIDLSKNQKLLNADINKDKSSTKNSTQNIKMPSISGSNNGSNNGNIDALDKRITALEQQRNSKPQVKKDNSSNAIQNPISNKKLSSKWCLVGEYEGKRGCIEVDNDDICISEKIYNNLGECINRPSI